MAPNLIGFVAATAIARKNGADDEEALRAGVIGGLFPNPLLGVVIAQSVTDGDSDTGEELSHVVLSVSVPPPGDDKTVYLAGTLKLLKPPALKNWQAAGLEMAQNDTADHLWSVELTAPPGTAIEYKYTLGSWDEEELDHLGKGVPERTLVFPEDPDTPLKVDDRVTMWKREGLT